MKFADNGGHIFELKSYSKLPIGYEYETTPYVFWFNNEYGSTLSINNYYVLPIRIVTGTNTTSIELSIESNIFKFYDAKFEQSEILEINESDFTNHLVLGEDNRIKVTIDDKQTEYHLYTFYVFAYSENPETWLSNILIKTNNKEYCPITVAATFEDEIEQLIINGKNIGVSLPKDIIKAVYQSPYYTDTIDENMYNTKLKEYLINHMVIKSECGNYRSAIASLKWFGWGNKISLSKLIQTDNKFVEQFIHDYFDIKTDVTDAFKLFKQTTLLSLSVKANQDTGEYYSLDNTTDWFNGEGTPELESLLDKTETVNINGLEYTKSYYRYTFNELAIKLSCLANMYKKYFLPIHLSIHSASIREQVYANDTKFLTTTFNSLSEHIIFTSDSFLNNDRSTIVKFDNTDVYELYNSETGIFIDSNCNVFEHYTGDFCEQESDDIFYNINKQLVAKIPIYFETINSDLSTNDDNELPYNCTVILTRNDDVLIESNFSFCKERYNYFAIVPKLFTGNNNATFWEDSIFTLNVCCNGVWYYKTFKLQIPNLYLKFGKLTYSYKYESHRQINRIESDGNIVFNVNMFHPNLVKVNNSAFFKELYTAYNLSSDETERSSNINKYINMMSQNIDISDNDNYYNRIHVYNFAGSVTTPSYTDFFKLDGTERESVDGYDTYIMHDDKSYYVVFISKKTINEKFDKTLPKELTLNGYTLKHFRSDNIFLINRMKIEHTNGENHFNADDIITCEITNVNLPFILSLGSKWTFTKISLGGTSISPVTSKTNTAIVSIDKSQYKYVKGYYDVTVEYSIDDYYQHNRNLTGRFRID